VLTPANKESASSSHVLRHFFVDCLAGKVVQFVNVISSTRSSGGDAVLLGSLQFARSHKCQSFRGSGCPYCDLRSLHRSLNSMRLAYVRRSLERAY
jgi:hypothetical protein